MFAYCEQKDQLLKKAAFDVERLDEHLPVLKAKVLNWIDEKENDLPQEQPERTSKKEGKLFRKLRELTEKEQSEEDLSK